VSTSSAVSASKMTYIVSGGAFNSTHSLASSAVSLIGINVLNADSGTSMKTHDNKLALLIFLPL